VASTIINADVFLAHLKAKLNTEMLAAAEPVLQEAMEKVEFEMRKKLSSYLIAMIDGQIDIMRSGTLLQITIKRDERV